MENSSFSPPAEISSRRMARAMIFGLGILALLLLAILILQLRAIWLHYQYYVTTGGENLTVYGIWKVQEGHPLYAWPNKDFYQLTLYNFGFYYLYAAMLDLIHARGPLIMLYGRYLTVVFSVCGLFVQTRLLHFLTKDLHNHKISAAIWLACFCTWFNSYFPGFYPVSVRPDVAAVVLSTLGIYCFIIYAAKNELRWVFAAATAWVMTWCVKQADVACIFGAGVYLVASRKWSAAIVLSLTFAIPVALILGLGSEAYRWNILVAPTANSLYFVEGAKAFLTGWSRSLFAWTFVATLPLCFYFYRTRQLPARGIKSMFEAMRPKGELGTITALAFVTLAGFVPSFLALSKTGSSLNQMYEVFVAATSLSFVLALRVAVVLPDRIARRFSIVIGASLISMCFFPICQLAMNRIGPIARASVADAARQENFSTFLKMQKAPVLIENDIYSLPWHSTGNQYPAIVIDHIFFDDAKKRGMISGGLDQLIARHWFATLYLETSSPLYQAALKADYQNQPLPEEYARCLNGLGQESQPHILLSAP